VKKRDRTPVQRNNRGLRLLWCVLSLAAVVLWGRLIFGFSAQNAAESSSLSERVSYAIADELTQFRQEKLTETERQSLAEKIEHPVRKGAHMAEYAVFALLLFNLLCALGLKGKKRFPVTLLLVFLYACTDEWHQLYVPGRSGRFTDVLIDTLGGFLMLLGVAAVMGFLSRKKKASCGTRKNCVK
jgi:VanZ family protein